MGTVMAADEPLLTNSDERMLRALAIGETHEATLDWVALQHLKQKGLVEQSATGPKITDKGRQALATYQGPGH